MAAEMTIPPPPPKARLDAETDQALASFRQARKALSGPEGNLYLVLSAGMTAQIREQFPGIPAGRLVMAVAQSMKALARTLEEIGIGADADTLLSVAGLAAEQLERERPS